MAEGGRDGGRERELPRGRNAAGRSGLTLAVEVFLHYVLDLWFEQDVKPRLRQRVFLIRYADDFVIGFRDHLHRLLTALSSPYEAKAASAHFQVPPVDECGYRTFCGT